MFQVSPTINRSLPQLRIEGVKNVRIFVKSNYKI